MPSATPLRPPWGWASRAATSAGVRRCPSSTPSRARTRSGRWQTASTACPTASRPATATTASAQRGITGSCSAGAFRGSILAPSASTSTTSAARRQVSTAAARASLPVGSIRPHSTTPCASTRARSFSPSVSPVRGRRGWGLMWVVVVTMAVRPAARASRARAKRVEVLPPAPTRATTRWRSGSRRSFSQMSTA